VSEMIKNDYVRLFKKKRYIYVEEVPMVLKIELNDRYMELEGKYCEPCGNVWYGRGALCEKCGEKFLYLLRGWRPDWLSEDELVDGLYLKLRLDIECSEIGLYHVGSGRVLKVCLQ